MLKHLLPLSALVLLAGCAQQTVTNDAYSTSSASDAMYNTSSTSSDAMMMDQASSTTMTTSSDSSQITMLKGSQKVVLHTSKGDIVLMLDADAAPKTVTNFVTLARQGYYEGLTFHRVIPGFMIQGGDPSGNGTGGSSIYGDEFNDEIDASSALYKTGYKAGVIAMANRGPNTNGSQFFIMDADYPLPPNYTIFGHLVSGQDIVHKIATTPTSANDRPATPVTFKVEIVK